MHDMYVIADAWKSKISWFYWDSTETWTYFTTDWFNPNLQDISEMKAILLWDDFQNISFQSITNVFYFGAWCSNMNPRRLVSLFEEVIPSSKINIDNDVLWAAYAWLWNKEWIVAILWTWSNTIHYSGKEILQNKWWHGILMWSEWSWMYLWNQLLHDYCFEVLPIDLQSELNQDRTVETLKNSIYSSANKYKEVASWSTRRSDHRWHPRVENTLYTIFNDFYDLTITRYNWYEELPLAIIWSVWYAFKDIVEKIGKQRWISEFTFLKKPITYMVEHILE